MAFRKCHDEWLRLLPQTVESTCTYYLVVLGYCTATGTPRVAEGVRTLGHPKH